MRTIKLVKKHNLRLLCPSQNWFAISLKSNYHCLPNYVDKFIVCLYTIGRVQGENIFWNSGGPEAK